MYLERAKQVWNRAKEMIYGVGNLRRSYDLHEAFFSIFLDDMSLEDYYGKFRGNWEEIDLSEPIRMLLR